MTKKIEKSNTVTIDHESRVTRETINSQLSADLIEQPEFRINEERDRQIALQKKTQFDWDHMMVKGTFRFHECKGGVNSFFFRKYKADVIKKYTMIDGNDYEVPQMVADHLNDNCKMPKYRFDTATGVHPGKMSTSSRAIQSNPAYNQVVDREDDRMNFYVKGPSSMTYSQHKLTIAGVNAGRGF